MKPIFKSILFVAAFVVGCSNDTDNSLSTEPPVQLATSLETLNGTRINSESLTCRYQQSFGATNMLQLQLQYLDSTNNIAFALYISDPVPAEPYTATAGEQGSFNFEVFLDGVSYRDELANSEIEVQLDNLASPDSLSNGDNVSFNGKLLIKQFSLIERSSTSEIGSRVLDLSAGNIGIDCEAEYELSETVN